MLGRSISDPNAIEGPIKIAEGLSLLDMETELGEEKILRKVSGGLARSLTDKEGHVSVKGYEIHAGISRGAALERPFSTLHCDESKSWSDGAVSQDGMIAGTYVHGVFDSTESCEALLKWAGLSDVTSLNHEELCERH